MAKLKEEKEDACGIEDEFGLEGDTPEDKTTNLETDDKQTTSDDTDSSETTDSKETETPERDDVEDKTEETVEPTETETPEKTWKDFGLEDFEGKSNEEIATIIKQQREESHWSDQRYGKQANEVGDLRQQVESFRKQLEEKKEPEEKPKKAYELIPDLTEEQVADFNEIYEKSPMRALMKYGTDSIRDIVKEEVSTSSKEIIGSLMSEQSAEMEFDAFISRNPDISPKTVQVMQTLDGCGVKKEKHLGGQGRSFEELRQLASLSGSEGQKNPLYAPTYQLMCDNPTMSFSDAHEFAGLRKNHPEAAEKKRAAIEKVIEKIDAVNLSATAKTKTEQTGEVISIEDEFEC